MPPAFARRYRDDGLWTDESLGHLLSSGLTGRPDLAFVTRSDVHPFSGTFGEVADLARRVAGGLAAAGVRPGDPVAFQLPNWIEAAATFYAAAELGAVVVPIVHFYGPREVGYILRQSEAPVLVTADRFGRLDYLSMVESLRPSLPALESVFVVGATAPPAGGLDRALLPSWAEPFATLAAHDPGSASSLTDPDTPALVAYTSGTTADPKGVVHTHRTIGAEIRQLGATQEPTAPPALTGAPVGHGIGMLGALLIPVYQGRPVHLIDVWDPGRVLASMVADGVSAGAGSTYFLTSLLDHPDFGEEHLALMRHIGLGGSSIPLAVSERATDLGISIVRMYGSTEHPSTTGSTHAEPLSKRVATDGRPLPGCEIRLVDESGRDVAAGTPGEILSRGPDCFAGYTDPGLTDVAFDQDGWYRTEDIGVLDEDGYLTITDRRKDIIIRGGENISAAEVEQLLLGLPGVAEVAVVAAPDSRLGEHAAAVFRMLPGAVAPALPDVRAHLERSGLARQKWPEELRSVEEFPRTASGKIQKFALRDRLRNGWEPVVP